jgi:hypothetical protein
VTAADHGLLDAAVRKYRGVTGIDHTPFLEDPATVALPTLEDGEVIGRCEGCELSTRVGRAAP